MSGSNGGPPKIDTGLYWAVYLAHAIGHALRSRTASKKILRAALAEFARSPLCSDAMRRELTK